MKPLQLLTTFTTLTLCSIIVNCAPATENQIKELQNDLSKLEQRLWGIEVRLMHTERLLFNNHPMGMTPGGVTLMPLRSPGAIVRRNETTRRRGGMTTSQRETPETEGDSYF